ncbi:molecular chaperone DnaJ [Microbulbifer sp. ZKSA006]|uniref:molecular chaperone DnaJ n=1 Tax=Microbulbifer sp. ZKSA006 TaxID=3243390 RepID=UPI00403943FC
MSKTLGLVVLALMIGACASTTEESNLGYEGFNKAGISVGATLTELKSDPKVSIRNSKGWTIATLDTGRVMWSFTPQGHPAHPSFVKREVIEKDGSVYIDTTARCGAEKSICDQLVRDFIELNNKIKSEMSGG